MRLIAVINVPEELIKDNVYDGQIICPTTVKNENGQMQLQLAAFVFTEKKEWKVFDPNYFIPASAIAKLELVR